MTANQLMAASNAETERHNQVLEELQQQSNAIAQSKVDLEDRHNQEMERITKAYNDTYLAMQQSQGDRKLDLQAELNRLEEEKNSIQMWYDTETVALKAREQALAQGNLEELTRWHDISRELSEHELTLNQRKIEFQNSQFLLENQMAINTLAQKQLEWTQKYELELSSQNMELRRLQLESSKWYDTLAPEVRSEIFRNYISPFTGMFSNGMGSLPLLFK